MSTFKDRLIVEKKELDEKIQKLSHFIEGDNFETIPLVQASLLRLQLRIMRAYSDILKERLDLL